MKIAQEVSHDEKIVPLKKMVGPLAINYGVPKHPLGSASHFLQKQQFSLLYVLLVALFSFALGLSVQLLLPFAGERPWLGTKYYMQEGRIWAQA
jgi:hypothetical protein